MISILALNTNGAFVQWTTKASTNTLVARFAIPDFRIRRIGHTEGPLVRSLSHAAREALEDKLKEDNAKLVASLNKQIAKQEKKLKLSLADVMSSKFGGMFGPKQ